MTLKAQVGDLLVRLRVSRGQTRQDFADQLGTARQITIKIERGGVSFDRLDSIGELLGLRFALVAFDPATGDVVDASAQQLAEILPP